MLMGVGISIRASQRRGGAAADPLARWRSGNTVSGRRVTFWGDSTTQVATGMFDRLSEQIIAPGGEWEGAIVTNQGYNGQTMDGALSQTMATLVASNPNLVVLCFGLNNVRIGTDGSAQLQIYLGQAVAAIKAQIPAADILMWTPNSMLSTDPNSAGTVVPVSSAQDYTDRIWNAYNNLKNTGGYSNVAWLDKMAIFGRVCPPTSPLMTDILHPNQDGQWAAMEPLIEMLKPAYVPINLVSSAAAWTSNPNNPWTVYSRALEDTRYCSLVKNIYVSLNIEFGSPGQRLIYMGRRRQDQSIFNVDTFQTGDFFWSPSGVYTITGGENKSNIGSNNDAVQMSNFIFPSTTTGNARLYRKV